MNHARRQAAGSKGKLVTIGDRPFAHDALKGGIVKVDGDGIEAVGDDDMHAVVNVGLDDGVKAGADMRMVDGLRKDSRDRVSH